MFHAGHVLAEFSLIGFGCLMTNKLRFRVRMLGFGQPGKVLIANRAFQSLLRRPVLTEVLPLQTSAQMRVPL